MAGICAYIQQALAMTKQNATIDFSRWTKNDNLLQTQCLGLHYVQNWYSIKIYAKVKTYNNLLLLTEIGFPEVYNSIATIITLYNLHRWKIDITYEHNFKQREGQRYQGRYSQCSLTQAFVYCWGLDKVLMNKW